MARFISYVRVSTAQQGRSGLGLDAQRCAVAGYLRAIGGVSLAEYQEIESGKKADRPQLAAALARCKLTGATLIIAKLDRLSRNVAFLANLMDSGADFVAVDMPNASRLTLHIMASIAENEAAMISHRTKAALAQSTKKLGGWRGGPVIDHALGNAANRAKADQFVAMVAPVLNELYAAGHGLQAIADSLAAQHIQTPRGGQWTPSSVRAALIRLDVYKAA